MNGKRLLSSIVWTFLASALNVSVHAQTATSGDSSASASKNEGAALEEVVVTARHERENLQNVPISITAISGEEIRQKNITDPEDFNTTVPGLTVQPAYLARDSATYTIRGQGQILGGAPPAVATYFNDVPTIVTGSGYFFDLENIEVLKGPQGTLFGLNSTGGAVLLVPQRPTNDFEGYVDATVGNYHERRYQAVVNVPLISDVLLVRFAVDDNMRDGYTTNPVNGQQYDDTDYQAGRIGVIFRPNDRFENYFLFNVAALNEHGAGLECLNYNPEGDFGPALGPEAAACAAQLKNGPRLVNAWIPPVGDYVRSRNYAADDTLTIKVTDDITLKNIFGYREFLYQQSYDSYGLPFPIYELYGSPYYSAGEGVGIPSERTYSDELQLHGDSFGRRLHWQTGLFFNTTSPYSTQDRDLDDIFGTTIFSESSLDWSKTNAVYGQGTYSLTDKLNLTVGGRYTQDIRSQISNNFYPALFTCPPPPGKTFPPSSAGLGFCDVDQHAKFHSPTWNVSLEYQLDPATMLYIASRRGYKSGGFNDVAPTPTTQEYEPEHVTDVELGEKTEFSFGDVKGRLNADVFYSKFIGWQERVTAFYPTAIGETPFAIITNVADGVVKGADLEATIIPTAHIELSGFYTYLDPYFTSNMFQGENYVHSPVADVVRHKISTTARYLFGLPSSVGDVSISATAVWQSAQVGSLNLNTTPNADPYNNEIPKYGVLNMRADWKRVMGYPVDLSAFCNNVTNKVYLVLQDGAWASGQDTGEYGPPRMFGAEVRWHFGHY